MEEIDPIKLVEECTDVKHLEKLSEFVDMDIENLNNDSNKFVKMLHMSEEEYQEDKKKGLEWFKDFKTKIENRITKLKQ